MTYKNKKTGQVIQTTGKVVGQDWELVKSSKPEKKSGKQDREKQTEGET